MYIKDVKPKNICVAVMFACLNLSINISAAPLNTSIPATVDIPAQPLASALKQYAKQSGQDIVFDNRLTDGKLAPAVKGNFDDATTLKKLLDQSGLEANVENNTIVVKRERVQIAGNETSLNLEEVQVRAKRLYEIGPLPGLGLTKDQIPGNVQSITAKEIKESHSLSMSDLFNKKLQSVTVNDYQGNPFQMDVQYRGFTAGPQIGTPQGLSVFFDGIRVNEPFGDVVNWDMIPMNAIASVDVFPGSNPVFGLNTLGGAFTVKTKDGFNHEGIDAEVLAGSYGRKQLQVEGGVNNGTFALFGAGNFFLEDGWREDSPSEVNQFFGKASYRGEKLDLNLSTLIVGNDLVGNGLLPSEQYAQDRNSVFTSPDTTKNRLQQFQLSAAFQANDNFSITGQVYRRNSKRHQVNGDVFTDWRENKTAKDDPAKAEGFTCLFRSTNPYGLPDYIIVPANITQGEEFFTVDFFNDFFNNNGVIDLSLYEKNAPLTDANFVAAFQEFFYKGRDFNAQTRDRDGGVETDPLGPQTEYAGPGYTVTEASYAVDVSVWGPGNANQLIFQGENVTFAGFSGNYFYSKNAAGDDIKNYIAMLPPENADTCLPASAFADTSSDFNGPFNIRDEVSGVWPKMIDGAYFGQPGYVEGTPTALITDNNIDQSTDGASVQFNWNFEKHKFMIGASIDAASASYSNTQLLGMLDANRHAFLAPELIHPQFAGATIPINNNDFSGTNTTKSIYFSETWTPVEAWNFNASGRYNQTKTKNEVATRYGFFNYGIGDLINWPYYHDTCTSDEDCANKPTGYRAPTKLTNLEPAETEAFSYYSFNPSLGATWQAKENLNVYANWSKGTRVPSVIELGCAFDDTPVYIGGGAGGRDNPKNYKPKSIIENRSCTLPTTLSGDPYLPQIKATSYDVGMRGSIGENLQWNVGAYQTDLKDDIYFVATIGGAGFFDTVGKTRRRGLEAGLSGQKDKWGFSVNYSLTDATFEDTFDMYSEDNSSAILKPGQGGIGVITVKEGSTMPGVPLHNLNASVSYAVTPKWQVGMSAVVHSESYVRGNENNEHKTGQAQTRTIIVSVPGGNSAPMEVERQRATNPGKLPGYATFNFQTSYQFNSEWTASMLINNVFDKEYFSAGRLGRNPFSPSINGAIGPDGYNHNSSDWLSTNFIAPSAPRGIWFSLNWHFDPTKPY
jgi:outer membrane receptor protein involved in Fe transport